MEKPRKDLNIFNFSPFPRVEGRMFWERVHIIRDKLPRRRHRSARTSLVLRWKAPTFGRADNRYLLLYNSSVPPSSRQEEKEDEPMAAIILALDLMLRPQNRETSAERIGHASKRHRFYRSTCKRCSSWHSCYLIRTISCPSLASPAAASWMKRRG